MGEERIKGGTLKGREVPPLRRVIPKKKALPVNGGPAFVGLTLTLPLRVERCALRIKSLM